MQRDEQVELLGMPKSAVAFLAPLLAKLMAGLSAVAEAQRRSKVEIGADGMLQLPAITALADLAEPVRTRETVHNLIGSVQFPDMLREVAVTVRRVSLAAMERGRRRIGPAHFSHINVRGTMRFGVEQYAQALVRRGPACAARVASWQG